MKFPLMTWTETASCTNWTRSPSETSNFDSTSPDFAEIFKTSILHFTSISNSPKTLTFHSKQLSTQIRSPE